MSQQTSLESTLGSWRVPSVYCKPMEDHLVLALRFSNIGDRKRFRIVLQRFRFDFPLSQCIEINGLAWWVIPETQKEVLADFCRRNGLQLEEE